MLQEVETHEQNKFSVLACSVPGYHIYWLEILFETKNKINKINKICLPTYPNFFQPVRGNTGIILFGLIHIQYL